MLIMSDFFVIWDTNPFRSMCLGLNYRLVTKPCLHFIGEQKEGDSLSEGIEILSQASHSWSK